LDRILLRPHAEPKPAEYPAEVTHLSD